MCQSVTPPIQLHWIHIPQMAYRRPWVTRASAPTRYISDDGLSSSDKSLNGERKGKALNRVQSTHHIFMIWHGAWQGPQKSSRAMRECRRRIVSVHSATSPITRQNQLSRMHRCEQDEWTKPYAHNECPSSRSHVTSQESSCTAGKAYGDAALRSSGQAEASGIAARFRAERHEACTLYGTYPLSLVTVWRC